MSTTPEPTPSIESHYSWTEQNRSKAFESWADEVRYGTEQGYTLVPPDYVIPHWSVAMSGIPVPKLFVMRKSGMDEMRNAADRPARDFGYPLFFKKEDRV